MDKKLRIVFFGTPEFAVAPLKKLVEHKYSIVGVVTAPDRASGRGLQLQASAVKKYAMEKNLHLMQPEKLKSTSFINELQALKADLQIVVAFRMLPEVVWNMPPLGTFNLHASLLPAYRGAAPINWALINGEKETGITTFFLTNEIDTGDIIEREKIKIDEHDNAGTLHDKLMNHGADLVLKTVNQIESGTLKRKPQEEQKTSIKKAPKLFKSDGRIDWTKSCLTVSNIIRGLSPYPAAFTEIIKKDEKSLILKITEAQPELITMEFPASTIISDGKSFLKIACSDGFLHIKELQLEGKKKLTVDAFLRGFSINGYTVKN
jgi:methionyl-tRNA formyltransferase